MHFRYRKRKSLIVIHLAIENALCAPCRSLTGGSITIFHCPYAMCSKWIINTHTHTHIYLSEMRTDTRDSVETLWEAHQRLNSMGHVLHRRKETSYTNNNQTGLNQDLIFFCFIISHYFLKKTLLR